MTLPAAFDLLIPRKNKKRPVRMLWRRADVVGVSFADHPPPKPAASGEAALKRELRERDAELARLRNRIAGSRKADVLASPCLEGAGGCKRTIRAACLRVN